MISPILDNMITEAFQALDKARVKAFEESQILIGASGKDTRKVYGMLDDALSILERIEGEI